MGLKIRIVVMKPDHNNDIFVLKKKKLEGKKFTHNDSAYFINDDHFQITTDKPWWRLWTFKRYFTTYYYVQGQSQPLPVPAFRGMRLTGNGAKDARWEHDEESDSPLNEQLSAEEVAAAFNPWFYRIIAAPVRDVIDQIHFYVSVATLLGVLYLAWRLQEGDGSAAADAVSESGVSTGP